MSIDRRPIRAAHARGFSLVEMMVAMTISLTLLAATLSALDTAFKSYTATSEAASNHLVSRLVMHRVLAMIRTGREFGPYPSDVLDVAENPHAYTSIEFVSFEDRPAGVRAITKIERRASGLATVGRNTYTLRGPYTLWMTTTRTGPAGTTVEDHPLIDGVVEAFFILEYDVGPRLRRATVDLTLRPRGEENYELADARTNEWTVTKVNADGTEGTRRMVSTDLEAPTIRLVASTGPRQLN